MNREQILNNIRMLSNSQEFYDKLYNDIKDNDEALDYLEQQNFKDVVDLILFLEG